MQTSKIPAERATLDLEARFTAVRQFLKERGVVNYFSAFAAVNVQFSDEEQATIRQWWNKRALIGEDDARLVDAMERAVEQFKPAA